MIETVKEARIRAAIEQTERFGGVQGRLAQMLVDKIKGILSEDEGAPSRPL